MNSWKLKRKEVICINFHTICRKSTLLFDDENSPKYEKFAFKWTTRKSLIASHSLRTIFPALYAKTTSVCHYPPHSVRKRPHLTSAFRGVSNLPPHWDLIEISSFMSHNGESFCLKLKCLNSPLRLTNGQAWVVVNDGKLWRNMRTKWRNFKLSGRKWRFSCIWMGNLSSVFIRIVEL